MTAATPTADETRARILQEAERLFRHYGYAKTTVADIADACGMSSANVYRFFASKLAINEAICDRIISGLEKRLLQIVKLDVSASERLTMFIGTLAQHTVETLIDQKKVHEMVVVAMEEQWDAIDRHLQALRAMIATMIESGISTGEFPSQDATASARCVLTAIVAMEHPVVVAQCRDDPNVPTPEMMSAFILRALQA